jgi:antitoxin component YwqK of YwqJK toxin-antitoxin module
MLNISNLQRHLSISALCATALLLQGCGSKIDCNSSKVKEHAIEIIQSHLNNAVWYKEMHAAISGTPELTSVKALSRNDELKQGQCSAKYTFTYNGKPREIDVAYDLAYLQDKGETEVKVAVADVKGGVMAIVMAERPIKNGVEKIMDPKTGNLQHKIEWKNGVQDGVEEIYNPTTNKLIAEIHVANGKKAGSEKRWNDDGSTLLIDLNWVDGKATGFEKHFDPTGQKLIIDLVWKEGKATGFQTVGSTGNLSIGYDEYQVKDGQFDGPHKKYRPRSFSPYGMFLSTVDNYKEGKLDGPAQEFNEAGKVVAERSYKNGIEGPASAQPASSATSAGNASSEACLDSKIARFHKEQGNDALISNDMITEWKTACGGH